MTSFDTSIQIDADPGRVWAQLRQTDRWPTWDDALQRVDGKLAPGGKVTFHVNGSSRAVTSKVVEWGEPTKLVLRGGMPLGLFAGTRTYSLTASGGGTLFRMTEVFSGPLAGLITRSIPDLQPSFDSFAAGLKSAAEAAARPA